MVDESTSFEGHDVVINADLSGSVVRISFEIVKNFLQLEMSWKSLH